MQKGYKRLLIESQWWEMKEFEQCKSILLDFNSDYKINTRESLPIETNGWGSK